MSRRIVRRSVNQPQIESSLQKLPALLRRVYLARGVDSEHELDLGLAHLAPPDDLLGIDKCSSLFQQALVDQSAMLIVADFDADGATSCALAIKGLRAMGAKHVDYIVPNRFEYGYGLSPEIVDLAAQRKPDILITVDNGISSIEGVSRANALGIRVWVTDHHLPGQELPAAEVIVNPNQPADRFASKNLAGVGVMFYVLLALRKKLRDAGWFQQMNITEPNLADFLDLVALGTVADVVPLDRNNRILVEQGLKRIRAGKCCFGIKALLRVANRDSTQVVASDIGFAIGPRLNAAGRLADMSIGIECLLSQDMAAALSYAQQLDSFNKQRREIEADMQDQALLGLDELLADKTENLPAGICLYRSDWHQGVVGILASRIKERYFKPVIAFADADGALKGSARSVSGLHIRDALETIATANPELIMQYGGHAMAAGLTLSHENYDAFSAAFAVEVSRRLDSDQSASDILSDGAIETDDLNLASAQSLRHSGPWGQGFPEPLFDGIFVVVQQRVLAGRHLKLMVKASKNDAVLNAIVFNHAYPDNDYVGQRVQMAYHLDVNEYNDTVTAQLRVIYLAQYEKSNHE